MLQHQRLVIVVIVYEINQVVLAWFVDADGAGVNAMELLACRQAPRRPRNI
jgi:hypothetical protein